MATRVLRPTRFSHDSKSVVVDIDQGRIETSRRIEKGTARRLTPSSPASAGIGD